MICLQDHVNFCPNDDEESVPENERIIFLSTQSYLSNYHLPLRYVNKVELKCFPLTTIEAPIPVQVAVAPMIIRPFINQTPVEICLQHSNVAVTDYEGYTTGTLNTTTTSSVPQSSQAMTAIQPRYDVYPIDSMTLSTKKNMTMKRHATSSEMEPAKKKAKTQVSVAPYFHEEHNIQSKPLHRHPKTYSSQKLEATEADERYGIDLFLD
jgi:hypothetical protein